MPFKRNPVQAEKIDSLARALAQMPRLAWDNAAHSLLERTLDDSANRRSMLSEAFLITDELLVTAQRLLAGLEVDETAIARNLSLYSPFAATERILMALVKSGADRQEMHERLREHAMDAWKKMRAGEDNPLADYLASDPVILQYLDGNAQHELMDASRHLGNAPQRARQLADTIQEVVTQKT